MTADTDPCEPCVAEALLEVASVRDRLHAVLWAEAPAVSGINKAINDLFRARRMLVDAGVEQ